VGAATEMAHSGLLELPCAAHSVAVLSYWERVFFTVAKFFVYCVPTAVRASINSTYLQANREPRLWVLVPSCITSNVRMTFCTSWLIFLMVADELICPAI
jgi:hypothetical protein